MNDVSKQQSAKAALAYIEDNMIVGVGTGSTAAFFIEELATIKHRIDAAVASSKDTEAKLRALHIPVIDLNVASEVSVYIDGADEVNPRHELIKGGGGALTREKIIATVAKKFIVMVDESKMVKRLGEFPLAVEVLPMARSYVARQLVKMGGSPVYREDFMTDNGNIILDVYDLPILTPMSLEKDIKSIPGVIDSGLFAARTADVVLVAGKEHRVE